MLDRRVHDFGFGAVVSVDRLDFVRDQIVQHGVDFELGGFRIDRRFVGFLVFFQIFVDEAFLWVRDVNRIAVFISASEFFFGVCRASDHFHRGLGGEEFSGAVGVAVDERLVFFLGVFQRVVVSRDAVAFRLGVLGVGVFL